MKKKFQPVLDNENAAMRLLTKGNNQIKGSALMRQAGGGIVTCAGNEVTLTPNTAYAKERMQAIYGNIDRGFLEVLLGMGVKFSSTAEKYFSLSRKAVCDAQGYFEFNDVADGSFFLTLTIVWRTDSFLYTEGGHLMKRIDVKGGETTKVVLSP